ncbi:capsular biosynthesis protein [Brasilonema octagenarum UFV-E1]|uniref:non-specific protein-tyrosine kinase n=2 Tax=Brasilonema TaxID=383614 RepID=A0A856MLW7_9CYAN|nr:MULTISPECIES: tyrosine-protein kinase domain-containing protein [Brasilonema]NMF62703.1 capsular biosynthesis protein [Brasilonema octagenarum UFV-OR1]QDL10177.1 capsular biosynthesis protein [Brasilonema sennae CENA114]QDL16529.1 capsular biosynthesis protein [Brasilonema octagenarum UFV-E1]
MLKSDKYPHPLSQAYTAQSNEEGGLNLGQVGATLRRRALLIAGVTGVIATAAVLKAETDPPVYQGRFEILTKPVTGEGRAVANIPQSLSSQQGIASPELTEPVITTIQVLESRKVLDKVVEELQEKYKTKYPKLDYDSIVGGLQIASGKPNILEVTYTSADKELVRDVLTKLQKTYVEYSVNERLEDVNQAISFVRQQEQPLENRVRAWQERQRIIRQRHDLVEPAQKAQEISQQIATLTQQQAENRVQLEQMLATYEDLKRELAQQPGERAGNSVLSENARYQKILDQIQTVDIDLKKAGAKFTNENPSLQYLEGQKANLLPMLAGEENRVKKDYQSRIRTLQARDKSLGDKIAYFNNYLRNLAVVIREYDDIQRNLKIATEGLIQFSAKKQALQIEQALRSPSWKLLDPKLEEVNEPKTGPGSAKRNLALGTLLGLLLGTGAALVADKLSNVLYSSKDLKESTGLPLLGVVPLRKEIGALAWQETSGGMQQAAKASFFEVFRSLYTNILLLSSDTPIRSLVISSAAKEDGKTTVAIHLALAAAAMGQRVLLVDANLRSPTIHNRVGLMNIQGLTDVIAQDLDWNNVIERSPLEDNLFVLSAGPIPPDSIRLLASHKMQDLMSDLQASFDLVIYDTPPLVGFADANLLAANTNGLVLVAGLGKLKRTIFQQALDDLQMSGTPILGVIANKSKDTTPASYSYYQQYYKHSMSSERIGDDDSIDFTHSRSSSSSFRNSRRNS